MRRKYFGWAIAAIATLGPMQAWGGDQEIAEQIIGRLKVERDSGALKDFHLDMKVDQGVVLFRGNVSQASQKELLLRAADGIDGVSEVVDEVQIRAAGEPAGHQPVVEATPEFSFRNAVASEAKSVRGDTRPGGRGLDVVPGQVMPTAGNEVATVGSDEQVTAAVIDALRAAQGRGELRGFGVDVQNRGGVIQLVGQAGSDEQRDRIVRIAEGTPGVKAVRDGINVARVNAEMPRLPEPPVLNRLAPVNASPASYPMQGQVAAQPDSAPMHGGQMMGQPVPMASYGAGAPRHDSPYLPNYAWPGYAAYPNYAAVTYPQQYSPSAFPYIGPFYPYPQVPLGWRKVSLEWDDGWWFLDFSDR